MIKYLELYRDHMIVIRGSSLKTIEAYLRDIKQYFFFIKDREIDYYLEFLKNSNYSVATQNRKLSALRSYYKFLVNFKYTNKNPFKDIDFAKKEKKLPECLTYPEIIKILDYLKNDLLNKAMVEVLYGCGLRVSELVNLQVSDIHYKEGLIRCLGKGNKIRYVPINKQALHAINDYKINFRDKLKFKADNNILFLNKFGRVISRERVNVMLNKVSNAINLNKKIYPHMFRHSFSTHMLENGANLRAIQELLGHENLATTQIYTHVNKRKLIEDYNKYFDEE